MHRSCEAVSRTVFRKPVIRQREYNNSSEHDGTVIHDVGCRIWNGWLAIVRLNWRFRNLRSRQRWSWMSCKQSRATKLVSRNGQDKTDRVWIGPYATQDEQKLEFPKKISRILCSIRYISSVGPENGDGKNSLRSHGVNESKQSWKLDIIGDENHTKKYGADDGCDHSINRHSFLRNLSQYIWEGESVITREGPNLTTAGDSQTRSHSKLNDEHARPNCQGSFFAQS